ncbi:VQ motif-containing protein 9-like [Olea europaea var. sylvestris]|uniref:VQ motif-containing protein 9-like n=1 Tax=Olea europaea var. sylvestris TaxID=158386 RepID=UPI000C1CF9A9|nr:VQ motif-containing protein 9-like [Olea europaea var. sylvestris]XP_022884873.1 VQ motif-containing protein 9-like [Olea europaea var. sylvestris]XP_022884874.1 VQ motif-containing protein 9-like [Olea europaea var. sylvestris]
MEMDKASDANSTVNTTGGGGGSGEAGRDVRLNHVTKISHKISKPIRKHLPPTPPNIPIFENINQNPQSEPPQNNLQQPPVYNINKNDFRNVVQKLTGSPSHERPPPVSHPRPPSSRLQRIRPPPLAQISNHPPPLAQGPTYGVDLAQKDVLDGCQRALQPFSPLPPLPAVLAAAESPISAHMRFFQSSISSFAGALPRWNSVAQPQQQQPPPASSSTASPLSFPTLPLSPLPFGCMPSPRSPYAAPSPSLFLPTGQLGFPQLPLSPTLPVPSPRWNNM